MMMSGLQENRNKHPEEESNYANIKKREKAEQFAGQVKNLIAEEERELKRAVFRLELIIRKEQSENAVKQYEVMRKALKEYFGERWGGR